MPSPAAPAGATVRELFVTCPMGLESILAMELATITERPLKPGSGGIGLHGDLEQLYRIQLWSRVANRVMLVLDRGRPNSQSQLYELINRIPWEIHFGPEHRLMVRCTGTPRVVNNSHYAALLAKDAIVDRFRDRFEQRPSVDTQNPQFTISLHFGRNSCAVYLDLCGQGLHRRGYRQQTTGAPLRENIAAALLWHCDWPQLARQGGSLLDPMCGSGTFAIEAALMAMDIAPGLHRSGDDPSQWRLHDPGLWESLRVEARQREQQGRDGFSCRLIARDNSKKTLAIARANAEAAGVAQQIQFQRGDVLNGPPTRLPASPGLLITNPPYGRRLGRDENLQQLYYALGGLISKLPGWRAAVLLEDEALLQPLRLEPTDTLNLKNGPVDCLLARFSISDDQQALPDLGQVTDQLGEQVQPFLNRVGKNHRHLEKWARRQNIGAWRVYDRDLPDFALAVDLYQGQELWLHVQEYEAPKGVDPVKAQLRLQLACDALPGLFDIPPARLILKTRKRQKDAGQYQRQADRGRFFAVQEGPAQLRVNLHDYLDTGLFLDSRDIRAMIRDQADGKRLLNLFCYTATASVQAALGGADATTSVDLSNTYLDWARENFKLNNIPMTRHALVKADCRKWLSEQAVVPAPQRTRYDLILLDPPTISRSSAMEDMLDTQRDHVELIRNALALLAPGGKLYFCTNYRRFRLDQAALDDSKPVNISSRTVPKDFARNQKIHQCWLFQAGD